MSTATVPVTPGQLRSDLKAWLSEHGDGFALARADAEPLAIEETMAADLVLQRALWDAGFTRYGWPPSVGGLGGTAILRAAVYEQLVLAGFRVSLAMLTVETLGPVMVALAPEVSARYLPACLRGDEVWCQGFSEPKRGAISPRCAVERSPSMAVSPCRDRKCGRAWEPWRNAPPCWPAQEEQAIEASR